MKSSVRIIGVVVCFLVVSIAYGWWQVDGAGSKKDQRLIPASLADMDFQMLNHLGATVSPEQLVGKPTMIFFGFTYCPDICPNTLNDISTWIEALGENADNLNSVFITVDPGRDTVEAVREYLSYFNPRIEGWIGGKEELAKAAELFGITYRRVEKDDGEYTMDHTSGVYLFSSNGRFARTIDYHESREQALPKIKRTLSEQ